MSRFQTTRWGLIAAAARETPEQPRPALEQLCRVYRPPVLAYIRRCGTSGHDAEDLAQAFFLRFVERGWYAHADPHRGRFRALLLTALRHFLADAHAHSAALARGGGARFQDGLEQVADTGETPEEAFDRAWLGTVLARAMDTLHGEWNLAGKAAQFQQLLPFLLERPQSETLRRVAVEQGLRINSLAVQLHRMRKRLRQLVRLELLRTVGSGEALERELAELRTVLSGTDA